MDAALNIAEAEAFRLLFQIFPNIRKISERARKRTPDFDLGNDIQVEVYCPDVSQPDKEKTQKSLEQQPGIIKIALSHPVTGSDGLSLKFPANKTIDRVLNRKREHDQFDKTKINILWLDLKNKLRLPTNDCLPLKSVNHADLTYVGMFGIWHAFYGYKNANLFKERTVLRYLRTTDIYPQKKEGYFRENKHVSAAIALCVDGVLLFENPWAEKPIGNLTRRELIKIEKFKPELSFMSLNDPSCLLREIDWIFKKIDLLAQSTLE